MAYSTAVKDVNNETPPQIYGIGLFLLVIGAGLLALFAAGIAGIIGVRVEDEAFGITLLRYLDTHGILLPLIEVVAGIYLVMLSVRFWRREIGAGLWARQLMLWGIIAGSVMLLQSLGGALSGGALDVSTLVLLLVLTLGSAYSYWWIGNNQDRFLGQETLAATSSRFAWNLLVPTLLILVLVALRPLEETFVASLTDRQFAAAAGRQVNFVGFDNYARLLGFRIDKLDCVAAAAGGCDLNAAGDMVFPRARDVLDENYTDLRYRETGGFTIGGSRIILSARDTNFFNSIGNTLSFAAVSVTLELLLGLFIAMVINSKFNGRGLMRAAMLIPWAIPTVVSARLWTVILRDNSSGALNSLLTSVQGFLGMQQQTVAWLARPDWQIPAMIMIDVWKTTPFMALILLAGLQTIPEDIYEAADVDGANRVTQFFRLTLPLLRPTIAVALVFRTLDAIRVFDVFQVVLAQKQYSMATYNYYTLINSQQLGYASAVGVVMFVIILLFTIAYVRILGVQAE